MPTVDKPTPRPWHRHGDKSIRICDGQHNEGCSTIAEAEILHPRTYGESFANAALIVTAVNAYDALRELEAAAKGEHDDEQYLYAVVWLRTFLDWCRDTPAVQQAISEHEDPAAISEHFTVARTMTDRMIAALIKIDETRKIDGR